MSLKNYPAYANRNAIETEFNIRDDATAIPSSISGLCDLSSAAGMHNNAMIAGFVTSSNVSFSDDVNILNPFYFPCCLNCYEFKIYIKKGTFDFSEYGFPQIFDDDTGDLIGVLDEYFEEDVHGVTYMYYSLYFDETTSDKRAKKMALKWSGDATPSQPLEMWLILDPYPRPCQLPVEKMGAQGGDYSALPGDLTASDGEITNLSAARVFAILDGIEKTEKQSRLMWFSTAPNGKGCAHKAYATRYIPVFDDCVLYHSLIGPSLTRYTLQIGEKLHNLEAGLNKISLKKEHLSGSINVAGANYYPVRLIELNSGSTSITAVYSETAWISVE